MIRLPWPPSVNHYWGHRGSRRFLSPRARGWKKEATVLVRAARKVTLSGPVAVALFLYPPDRRRRDLDNVVKAVLDALVSGGLLKDDSQVVELRVVKSLPRKPGEVLVEVREVGDDGSSGSV